MSKLCNKCEGLFPLTSFYKHARMSDGYLNHCKNCVKKKRVSLHRDLNIEKIREYDRNRPNRLERNLKQQIYQKTDKGKSVSEKSSKAYCEKYPQKRKAVIALSNAVRDGLILRPEACLSCNSTVRVQGHHNDYSKPLEVIWLCEKCHKDLHKNLVQVIDGDRIYYVTKQGF